MTIVRLSLQDVTCLSIYNYLRKEFLYINSCTSRVNGDTSSSYFQFQNIKRGCCNESLQQPLVMRKNEQKSPENVGKCRKSPGFLYSNACPGLKTSAECGKPAPFSVMQPKSRINAFAIALCPASSRAFSGQKQALKRKALYGCSSSPV